jgi:triosephosphate isomerase
MNKTKRPIVIAGNWKMNLDRVQAKKLIEDLKTGLSSPVLLTIIVCPPFTSLETAHQAVQGSQIVIGAQNMDYRDSGAFTGEISPIMLTELKVKYVVIGHSERRQYFGETNTTVNSKIKAALAHNLIPIVCVGETLDERENKLTDAVVSRQVVAATQGLTSSELKKMIFAYEPVWAIGTGKVCEAKEANRVIKIIRNTISNSHNEPGLGDSIPILYGGSVNAKNISEQLAESDIDGSLVGGASLKADEFLSMIEQAQNISKLSAASH